MRCLHFMIRDPPTNWSAVHQLTVIMDAFTVIFNRNAAMHRRYDRMHKIARNSQKRK